MQKLKDKQKIFLVVYKVKTTLLEEFQVLEEYSPFDPIFDPIYLINKDFFV